MLSEAASIYSAAQRAPDHSRESPPLRRKCLGVDTHTHTRTRQTDDTAALLTDTYRAPSLTSRRPAACACHLRPRLGTQFLQSAASTPG